MCSAHVYTITQRAQKHAVCRAEIEQVEAEYARLQAAGARAERDAKAREKDAAKARAVRNQTRIWERALGVRIALQKGFAAADRLPGAPAREEAVQAAPDLDGGYERARGACVGAISELCSVLDVLMDRSEEAGAGEARAKRGRSDGSSVDALWEDLQTMHARFAPARDAAVDSWHRRTLLATGRTALRSQMHALNQSLSQQVATAMRDPTRAIERLQRPLEAGAAALCEPPAAGTPAASEAAAGVPGTYDDTHFYQVLLQEFLEAADVDSTTAAIMRVRSLHRASRSRCNPCACAFHGTRALRCTSACVCSMRGPGRFYGGVETEADPHAGAQEAQGGGPACEQGAQDTVQRDGQTCQLHGTGGRAHGRPRGLPVLQPIWARDEG